MTDATEPTKTIEAVERSTKLLDALQEREGAGVTELAEQTGMSKATVHNHLRTLENQGLLVREEDGTYDVGLRFLDIAHYVRGRYPITDIVEDEVDKLADESGELALFAVEEHWVAVTLHVAYGERSVQTPIYVGNREELHNTAVGKGILAHKPPEEIDEYIQKRGLSEITENTITDPDEFLAELERIRERGIAYNREESIHGLVGVGSPVHRHDGTVAGALSIIGPSSRMDEDRLNNQLADMITRSANIIEINSTSL